VADGEIRIIGFLLLAYFLGRALCRAGYWLRGAGGLICESIFEESGR
jgi:hypothetical protein